MISSEDRAARVDAAVPRAREIRQQLHRIPELAMAELQTAAVIRKALIALDIPAKPPLIGTDVIALLEGKKSDKNVTLRADMDALAVEEKSELPYKSIHPGVMHACGHDGHMAMVLGAAMVLADLRDAIRGSVRFVFQPGEELEAAGRDLVNAGALANPTPARVYALHGLHGAPAGAFLSRPGRLMAAADQFRVTIHGTGGHGSKPEDTNDPLLTAARIVTQIQTIAGHRTSALEPLVITVGQFHSGAASNAIPDTAIFEGTARYFKTGMNETIHHCIDALCQGACQATGATYDLAYESHYIPLINDDDAIADLQQNVTESFGADHWITMPDPVLGGEDFAYYLTEHKGAMTFLGLGTDCPPLHSPGFDFNDDVLGHGIRFFVDAALSVVGE